MMKEFRFLPSFEIPKKTRETNNISPRVELRSITMNNLALCEIRNHTRLPFFYCIVYNDKVRLAAARERWRRGGFPYLAWSSTSFIPQPRYTALSSAF